MTKRIAIIGAPSAGKTTLATSVFSALKQSGRRAEMVHEWIRFDIQAHGPMTSIWEQYRTRQHQKELEDAVPAEVDYVIIDGGLLLQYFFAVLYADPSDRRQRLVLQDMYSYFLTDLWSDRYDMVFYLPLIGDANLQDGTRYQSDRQIKVLDEHMKLMFTKLHRLRSIHLVNSGFEARLEEVMWKIVGEDYLTSQPHSAIFDFSHHGEADLIYR